jgi:hypothetical protein
MSFSHEQVTQKASPYIITTWRVWPYSKQVPSNHQLLARLVLIKAVGMNYLQFQSVKTRNHPKYMQLERFRV